MQIPDKEVRQIWLIACGEDAVETVSNGQKMSIIPKIWVDNLLRCVRWDIGQDEVHPNFSHYCSVESV
jgi:hypothetical protein